MHVYSMSDALSCADGESQGIESRKHSPEFSLELTAVQWSREIHQKVCNHRSPSQVHANGVGRKSSLQFHRIPSGQFFLVFCHRRLCVTFRAAPTDELCIV